jgi:hypothetical protein
MMVVIVEPWAPDETNTTDQMFSIEIVLEVFLIIYPVPSVCADSDRTEGSIAVSIQDAF